ncbi:MAG TPA: DUF4126 domain-containing protein [Longimicrobiales bacterium]|nr:DUF4126 domain-containing protein [Longimicrobiales bacterium]
MDAPAEALLGIALGIGLAAATGLRAFLPLLLAGMAARAGLLPITETFAWLATTPALVTLGVAAVVETLAYYIPGFDHALDVLAGPAAMAAGVVASASVMTDVPPYVLWPVAIIAGGGVAGLTKGGAALVRAKAGLATAGVANPVVSTAETVGALGVAALAIAVPLLSLLAIIVFLVWVVRRAGRRLFGRRPRAEPDA